MRLLVFSMFVTISAYGGAIGLAGGGSDMGHELNQRLPFQSPVFAAFALALIVGVPSSVAAWLVWRRDPRTGSMFIVAGVLLIGWIGVELEFIPRVPRSCR